MQSGITASQDLHAAFNAFTSDSTLFALPVTITNESLSPLVPLRWSNDFNSSLASLTPHLQPKTPIYLFLRKSKTSSSLTAITYVPSTAPVRSKTLFASTRSALVRDLGLEKFDDTLFCTDAEEILEPAQWAEREAGSSANSGVDPGLLSTEERELQSVKRAEEEERHGTQGRDLMGDGGTGGSGGGTATTWAGSREGTNAARSGIRMKITEEAKEALMRLAKASEDGVGMFVQFGIELATETLTLLASDEDVRPEQVAKKIPSDKPSYSFYHFPSATPATMLFIYVCPGSSKVKERMTYASSRNGVIEIAKGEGVTVTKKLEAGDPDELAEPRLSEELGLKSGGVVDEAPSSRQGFARPKRPGRR